MSALIAGDTMLLMATRPPATCFILPAVDSISSVFQGPTDTAASQLVVVISAQLREEVTPWSPMHQQHCRITTQDNYTQNSPRTKSEISKGSHDYSRLSDTSFSRTSILEKISGISTQEQGHSCCRREEFGCMCLWDTQRELSSTVFPGTSLPLNSIGLVCA